MKHQGLFVFMLSLFGNNHAQYCNAVGPSSNADSNVESVVFVGQSGQINHLGCPSQIGLELYLSDSTTLSAGSSYTLQVDFGTCGGNYAGAGTVWIDFDQSQTFSPNEVVGTWVGTPPVAPSVFNVLVPLNAHNGVTRMRVTQQEAATLPLDPCATFQWGSVMDFGINIVNGIDCSTTPGDIQNDAIVIPSVPFLDTGNLAYCYGNQNLVYASPDVYYRLNLNPTMQSITVSSCGSNFDTYLSVIDPNGQIVSYNDDAPGCMPSSYLTFEVNDLGFVYIVLEGWGNESGLFQIQVDANYVGSEILEEQPFIVYPNPVSNVLYLPKTIDDLEIYDAWGKKVICISSPVNELDLSKLPAGYYTLNYWIKDRKHSEKLIKE